MVYPGKPSGACQQCKKRKIKCDEATPACSQCIRGKRKCPGYIARFDLVLRDQTQIVQQRANKRNRRMQKPPDDELPGLGFPTTLVDVSDVLTISSPLVEPPERLAVCAFFTDFICIPCNPDAQRGFLECLAPLYQSTRPDSLLSLATSTVSLAIFGGDPSRRSCYLLARRFFGKSLSMTRASLQDSTESMKDETLLAVMLLSFYERITSAAEAYDSSSTHEIGALALIKHRGTRNARSLLSVSLYLAVYEQVISSAIRSPSLFTKDSLNLVAETEKFSTKTAGLLTLISAETAKLNKAAKELQQSFDTTVNNQVLRLLNWALEVDSQLKNWADNLNDEWKYTPATGFDCPLNVPYESFVYGEIIDFYSDLNISSVWNSYRCNRIIVNSIILHWAYYLRSSGENNEHYSRLAHDALETTQKMTDDICASVPYHLGSKTFGGPGDRSIFEYPSLNGIRFSAGQRRAAASLGGWFLLEPLSISLGAPGLREGQKYWISGQLNRLGRIYSIASPFRLSKDILAQPRQNCVAQGNSENCASVHSNVE